MAFEPPQGLPSITELVIQTNQLLNDTTSYLSTLSSPTESLEELLCLSGLTSSLLSALLHTVDRFPNLSIKTQNVLLQQLVQDIAWPCQLLAELDGVEGTGYREWEVEEIDWTSFYHCIRFPTNLSYQESMTSEVRAECNATPTRAKSNSASKQGSFEKPCKQQHHSKLTSKISQNAPVCITYVNRDRNYLRDRDFNLIVQPESRPNSQEPVRLEIKGMHAGLGMFEAKCMDRDNKQAVQLHNQNDPRALVNTDQWHALIAVHETLFHEHHAFSLASQHPDASPEHRRLAYKYAMPARMTRFGIHSFLELLHHQLPSSSGNIIVDGIGTADDDTPDHAVCTTVIRLWNPKAVGRATKKVMKQGYYIAFDNTDAVCELTSTDEHHMSHIRARERESPNSTTVIVYSDLIRVLSYWQISVVTYCQSTHSNTHQVLGRLKRAFCSNKKPFANILLAGQLQMVASMPMGSPQTLSTEAGSSIWIPLGLGTVFGSVLAGVMYFPRWRDTSRLLVPTLFINIGCYILGADSRFSNADLAVTWLFTAALNIAVLKDKLRRYLRTGGLMALLIATLGTLTAIMFTCTMSFPEGERYANPMVFTAVGMLPGTLFWEVVWLVLVQLLGFSNNVDVVEEPRIRRFPQVQGEEPRTSLRGDPFLKHELDVPRNEDYRFQHSHAV